jgi:predicted enzyme related to lactoylglutathione lyase
LTEPESQRVLVAALKAALERFSDVLASSSSTPLEEVVAQAPRPADEHTLGKRQLQIVELPALGTEDGLKTADIANAVGYELPNTYSTLQALTRNQVVEQVPGKEPQHWRLVHRYRAASQTYARAAELVQPGEWTTATDLSIAIRGDIRATDAIVAARLSHRILGGGQPPADAAERLAAEGVVVLPNGEADPRQRITWDELSRRAAVAQERRTRMAKGTLNYLQVPANDLDASARFYQEVFGWQINRYPSVAPNKDQPQTGYVGFLDSSGKIGGEFVLDRQASREPGLLPSILVDDIDETLSAVHDHGGEVVKPRTPIVEGTDWQALFRDPAGNMMALYQSAS